MAPNISHNPEIWWFRDRIPGHENQALGLIDALCSRLAFEVSEQPLRPLHRNLSTLLCTAPRSRPRLLIGAGHGTHLDLIAARRRHGGATVVLMKPTLPNRLFDLCIVPRHDRLSESGNIVISEGPLNRMQPAATPDSQSAIILIGGPSANCRWNQARLFEQIGALTAAAPQLRWLVTDSRRTPPATRAALEGLQGLAFYPHEQQAQNWLASTLPSVGRAWVTEDSASMIYEALSAGVPCGVLSRGCRGRVAEGVAELHHRGVTVSFEAWRRGAEIPLPAQPLAEAQRVAKIVIERCLPTWKA